MYLYVETVVGQLEIFQTTKVYSKTAFHYMSAMSIYISFELQLFRTTPLAGKAFDGKSHAKSYRLRFPRNSPRPVVRGRLKRSVRYSNLDKFSATAWIFHTHTHTHEHTHAHIKHFVRSCRGGISKQQR